MNDDLKKDRCAFDLDPAAFTVAMLIVLRLRDAIMNQTDPPLPVDLSVLGVTLSYAVDLIKEVADSWEDDP